MESNAEYDVDSKDYRSTYNEMIFMNGSDNYNLLVLSVDILNLKC